jgi:hypothetical protein
MNYTILFWNIFQVVLAAIVVIIISLIRNKLRMASPGMLCHVPLVRTDVSEEVSTSIIRVTRIGELGT